MAGKKGLDMLLSEYNSSVNLRRYIKCLLDEFAEVHIAIEDVVKYRYLAQSFGVMVDDIAYLVGASRIIYGASALGYFGFYTNPAAYPAGDDTKPGQGGILRSDSDKTSGDFTRTDAQLKNAIRARIIKITGNASIEQLITFIDLVMGRSIDIEIKEGNLKMDYIVHDTLSVAERVLMAYMLPDFKPVGVGITLKDNSGTISLVYSNATYPPGR